MNFSLILFLLVLFTGFFYVLDLMVFKPKRKMAAELALAGVAGAATLSGDTEKRIRNQYMKQPLWLEYSASFFRSFCLYLSCVLLLSNLSKFHRAP